MADRYRVMGEMLTRFKRSRREENGDPSVSSADLCTLDGVSRQNVSQMLHSLMKRGLIHRTGIRNRYRYSLTEEGVGAAQAYRNGSLMDRGRISLVELSKRPILYEAYRKHGILSYKKLSDVLIQGMDLPFKNAYLSVMPQIRALERGDARWWLNSGDHKYGLTERLVRLLPGTMKLIENYKPLPDCRRGRVVGVVRYCTKSYRDVSNRFRGTVRTLRIQNRSIRRELRKTRKDLCAAVRRLNQIKKYVLGFASRQT